MTREVTAGKVKLGGDGPFVLISGPCVIEDEDTCFATARELKRIAGGLYIPFIFKSSYDKANRTSGQAYRGPGIKEGLRILKRIKEELGVPVLSDVHEVSQVAQAAEVLDVLQVPALLSRQTDLIVEAARSGSVVNIKKGQFLAPWEMEQVLAKALSTGNSNIIVTERGTCFGYNNLVADMRSIPILRGFNQPVIFDVTHSLQLPGAQAVASGGERRFIPFMARAAVAVGLDGVYMEVHPDPDRALCDGPNSLPLKSLRPLLVQLKQMDELVKRAGPLWSDQPGEGKE